MSTFNGYFVESLSSYDGYNADIELYGDVEPWFKEDVYQVDGGGLSWPLGVRLPVAVPGTAVKLTGTILPGIGDSLYERIIVNPTSVDIGNIANEITVNFEVWNAYRHTPQTLDGISADGDSGLTINEPGSTPLLFNPMESKDYSVTVGMYGPATIQALYTFDFTIEAPTFTLTGGRVLTWSFEPNWREPPVEKLMWLTDIITSEDDTEQRIKLRTYPRREWSYTFTVSGRNRRLFDVLTWAWQANLYTMPIWTGEQALATSATAGDTTVYIDTTDEDFRVNGFILLMSSVTSFEVAAISALGAGYVTVSSNLANSWPVGTRVFPAVVGKLQDMMEVTQLSPDVWEYRAVIEVYDRWGLSPAEWSADTYRGLPLLTHYPNLRDNRTYAYQRKVQKLDNLIGYPQYDDLSGRPRTAEAWLWTLQGATQISALKSWLTARNGRQTGIWVPTLRPDMVMVETSSAASSTIRIENMSYSVSLNAVQGRQDLMIVLKSGASLLRRVVGGSVVSAQVEELTLDAVLGIEITPADVRYICWVEYMRLASDEVELKWLNRQLVECAHNLTGVNDDV